MFMTKNVQQPQAVLAFGGGQKQAALTWSTAALATVTIVMSILSGIPP
jgi:hypothetical protein